MHRLSIQCQEVPSAMVTLSNSQAQPHLWVSRSYCISIWDDVLWSGLPCKMQDDQRHLWPLPINACSSPSPRCNNKRCLRTLPKSLGDGCRAGAGRGAALKPALLRITALETSLLRHWRSQDTQSSSSETAEPTLTLCPSTDWTLSAPSSDTSSTQSPALHSSEQDGPVFGFF